MRIPSRHVRQVTGVSKKNKTDLDRAIKDMSLSTDANHMAALLDYKSVWPHVVSDAAMAVLSAEPARASCRLTRRSSWGSTP